MPPPMRLRKCQEFSAHWVLKSSAGPRFVIEDTWSSVHVQAGQVSKIWDWIEHRKVMTPNVSVKKAEEFFQLNRRGGFGSAVIACFCVILES